MLEDANAALIRDVLKMSVDSSSVHKGDEDPEAPKKDVSSRSKHDMLLKNRLAKERSAKSRVTRGANTALWESDSMRKRIPHPVNGNLQLPKLKSVHSRLPRSPKRRQSGGIDPELARKLRAQREKTDESKQ